VQSFERDGRTIHLIDTPGFDDNRKDDATITQELAFWLLQAYHNGFHLNGLVYCHRITDGRLQGSGLRALKVFKAMSGEHCYPGVIMVTTRWDEITGSTGRDHQNELVNNPSLWGDIVAGGGRVMPLQWNRVSALAVVDHILENPRQLTLNIQSELASGNLPLHETAAGRIVYGDYYKLKRQWETQIQHTETELDTAVREHHDRNQIDCRKEIEDLQTRVNAKTALLEAFRATGDQILFSWSRKIAHEMGALTTQANNTQQIQKLEESRERLTNDSKTWSNNMFTTLINPAHAALIRAREQGKLSGQYFSNTEQADAVARVVGTMFSLGRLTLAAKAASSGSAAPAAASILCTMM
jgi:hypothetical protein